MSSTHNGITEQLWSKMLHLYFRMSRGLTLGVRAVVRNESGKFLLVRHTYTTGWHFPGGGVEPGQTVKEALAAELRQEANLQIIGKPTLHGVFLNRKVSRRDHIFVYLCDTEGEVPVTSTSREIAEINFFGVEELPCQIDEGAERRIREIVRSQNPDDDW
ncbi:NUDIX domain-containing protein [Erythrobacter sp.]|uniref:NUDIX domain-containing protein n=1 Tax=Erythrobacter sp. TaxID=1042 RepID=UPI001425C638|nr:NUDIX domain-containing protein [Erythrobacter sp.]QIQ87546.1 MAG: NUDIX domain-containing protein [Erythrobacter sp.]